MRRLVAFILPPLLVVALSPPSSRAASLITETEAIDTAVRLARDVGRYTARHPHAPGALPEWEAGCAEAGPLLLVHTYPALRPSYYYVPLISRGGGPSFVTVDASTGQWQAYGGRRPGFPSVTREEAAGVVRRTLGREVRAGALRVVSAQDRRLYWHWRSPDGADELLVCSSDAARILRGTDAIGSADGLSTEPRPDGPGIRVGRQEPGGATVPPGSTLSRPGRDFPPAFDIADVPHHYQITDHHCGPAVVQMAMDYWGPEIGQQEIGEVADTRESGTHVTDMLRAAQFSAISTSIQNPALRGYVERGLGYGGLGAYWSYPNEWDPDFLWRHIDLKRLASSSCPVAVAMRYDPGTAGSHARLLKGYDDSTGVYILHDPWYEGVYQGPDLHFRQSFFDTLWATSCRWGGFMAPWEVGVESPPEVVSGMPFTVTANVTYRGHHPFDGQDEAESPTVTLLPSELFCLAPGESATKPLPGQFSDSGYEFEPVTWELVADTLAQAGALRLLARGLVHDSSSSYASYSDSIGARVDVPLSVTDVQIVTVGTSGAAMFTAIQDGVDFARIGDTVALEPGTYTGPGNTDISLRGKALRLRGATGAGTVVIDCEGQARGFRLTEGEGPGTIIENVTVRNGRAPEDGGPEGGGGLYLAASSPTLRNVIFESNSSRGRGGAVCCVEGASPLLERVTFVRNASEVGGGGGMWCSTQAAPVLVRCAFLENTAGSHGGAVFCRSGASAELRNCTLALNSAPEGGGIYCTGASPRLTDCIIYGNVGGAVAFVEGSSPAITRSCVYGNTCGDVLPSSCIVEGILFEDPLFCDTTGEAVQLQECSPCVGAGTDGGDIGAYPSRCACAEGDVSDDRLHLSPARPCPFRESTRFTVSARPGAGHMRLEIYNVRGQLVRTLFDGVPLPGERDYVWRGDDDRGNAVGAGVYLARCRCDARSRSLKLVLVR